MLPRNLFVTALILLVSCGRPKTVDDARLRGADAESGNWLMYGRTYDDHRFSPLNQINEQTIGNLGLAWGHEFGTTRGLEATPLVEDGVLYTSGSWSVVYAIDARTGEMRWTYDPKVDRSRAYFICCDVESGRGTLPRQGLCGDSGRPADRAR
jgi:quinohemoprotein ethanol dehydrogenase